ncbi:hypothetical protein F5Y16DRAFT_374825 [Xylariaceae sp. FL0255]|nr:hypothetical protein F5Y16DRAFT_374825 [Xylariaceae sp. FL0255]
MSLEDKLSYLTVAGGNDSDDDDSSVAEDRLVIGIDFGTTYSGVGWATKSDFDKGEINFITSWPGTGREEGKVPTEIWYDEDGEPCWGYDVPPDEEPFRWFKLLLLHSEDLNSEIRDSEFLSRARNMTKEQGKSAVELVADYLRLLWGHIMSTIERARGETVVEALPIHVVITVPAIWKGYARQSMRDAAEESGMLESRFGGTAELSFVPEPEAAAMSTLLEQGGSVKPGHVYIVCDAGGGTVDLISYEVASTNPLVLREAVLGTGGLCGGIFIDQTFERMCSGRLGARWKRLSKMGIREIMKNGWEYGIKPQYRPGNAKKEYIVALPAELFSRDGLAMNDRAREPQIKNGRIHFLDHHIKTTFEVVISEIEDLIEDQMKLASERNLAVTGIILVGGLGSSPYLYEHLKTVYSSAGIAVLQSGGIKPRTAICRGAVVKGFLDEESSQFSHKNPIQVASTMSRTSYGIMFNEKFDASRHLETDKVWDEAVRGWRAERQIRWYLKRGDHVSKMQPVRYSWRQIFGEEEKFTFNGILATTIYQCDDDEPPTRKARGVRDTIRELGTLRCDLGISFQDIPIYTVHEGKTYRKLTYQIELVPSGASVDFVLYYKGKRKGSETVKVQFS